MASLTDITVAVNSFVNSNYTLTPVAYDNVAFNTTNVTEYIQLMIVPNVENQVTLGKNANSYRQFGSVEIVVNVEKGKGSKRALVITDSLTALFRSKRISGIQFRTPIVKEVQLNNGYYSLAMYIGFYYDFVF